MSSGLSEGLKNPVFTSDPLFVNSPTGSIQPREPRYASRANLVHILQSLSYRSTGLARELREWNLPSQPLATLTWRNGVPMGACRRVFQPDAKGVGEILTHVVFYGAAHLAV